VKKSDGKEIEWITAWRVLSSKKGEVDLKGLPWLASAVKVSKSIEFIREWMCAEKVGVKATFPFRYKAFGRMERNKTNGNRSAIGRLVVVLFRFC
jgi:hypothetical protein